MFLWSQVFDMEVILFHSPKSIKSRWSTSMMGSASLFWASPNRTWYCTFHASVMNMASKTYNWLLTLCLFFSVCLQVHRHQFMGSQVIKMFAPKDDEVRKERPALLLVTSCWYWTVLVSTILSEQHAGVALSAVIRALDELQMVAIVRYAYDRRSNPQVGAAFPCIKQDHEVRS